MDDPLRRAWIDHVGCQPIGDAKAGDDGLVVNKGTGLTTEVQ
jgi:hypothetical protein